MDKKEIVKRLVSQELGEKDHEELIDMVINNLYFDEFHLVGAEMKIVYNMLKKNGFNVYYYNNVDEIDPTIMENKSVYLKSSHGIGLYKLVSKKGK